MPSFPTADTAHINAVARGELLLLRARAHSLRHTHTHTHEHIRLEENAKYTIQNGLFVRAILESLREEVGAQLRSVVLVTNAFHMPRSKAIFGYILGTAAAGAYIHIASRCLCRCLCVSLSVSRSLCVLLNE
eukprot:COSAG03_NODE_4693_length_1464_cov_4.609524_3_plen_132_part_00